MPQLKSVIDSIDGMKHLDFSKKILVGADDSSVNTIAKRLNEVSTIIETALAQERQTNDILSCILKTIPANIALISHEGEIILTNEGWNGFGRENGVNPECNWIGMNYLKVSENSKGFESENGKAVFEGLCGILDG